MIYCKITQANSARKNDIANFTKRKDFVDELKNLNKNVTANKNESNELSKKVKAISTKWLTKDLINKFSILNGAKYFSSITFQNCLVFIPAKKYIKYFSGTARITLGNLMECQKKILKIQLNQAAIFAPNFIDHHVLPDINFNVHCLINNNLSTAKRVINTYISYTLNPWSKNLNLNFTLKNCLFGSIVLTKNTDPGKYKYSGYGIDLIVVQNFHLLMEALEKCHYFWSWYELVCAYW